MATHRNACIHRAPGHVNLDSECNLHGQDGNVSGYKGKLPGNKATFDSAMGKFAYEYGQKLLLRQGGFKSLYWALDFDGTDSQNCSVPTPSEDVQAPALAVSLLSDAVFV